GQLSATLLDRSYSREQEREPDRLGIDYLVRGGYDPQGAVQLQEIFYRQIEGGAAPSKLAGIFRTHPFSKERMQDNRDYIRNRHPQAGGSSGREPYQLATAGLRERQGAYALYDQARQLEGKGETRQAIAAYLQAAAAAPEEYLILTGLGMAYLRAEEPAAARPHLARAVQVNGQFYLSRMGLGYVLLQQKETARAVVELEKSMQLYPTVQGGYLLAEGYDQSGQRQKAVELYRAVATADPDGKLGQAAAARLKALGG
ncbi:MAG: tetratricopeptide repeat protein, partial [Desulfuromonadales bacterium]|nr:tetratricopeptide repeat protein [Desulfuromonadales bacterium]